MIVPRSSLPLLAALALALGLALATSGCGGAGSAIDPVAKAADVTSHAGGSQILFTISIAGEGLPAPLAMKGEGDFNFQRREGKLGFSIENLPAELASRLHGRSLRMTEVYKNGVGYLRSPLLDGKLPHGARWLKIDLRQALESKGLGPSSLTSDGVNPSQFLQYLKAKGAHVSPTGHEAVRGVPTTRYSGTFDLLEASEQSPGANPALVRKTLAKVLPSAADYNVPLSVWIDGHNLVRRLSMDIEMGQSGRSGKLGLTMEFFDFGATPGVSLPPESETFDVTKAAIEASTSR